MAERGRGRVLKGLVCNLSMQQDSTVIHCDGQSAIFLEKNQVHH